MRRPTVFEALVSALVISVSAAIVYSVGQKELVIAENARSKYSIVLPEGAGPVEQYAARELQTFLKRIGGVDLPVVGEPELGDAGNRGPGIYIGWTARALSLVGEKKLDELGAEGLVLATGDDDLVIAGGGPRGTLYGVYALLEDHLGCRWYAPDGEFIPSMRRVALPRMFETQKPAFEYREPFFTHAFDGAWAVRNRTNGNTARITDEQGSKIKYSHFVHTFYYLVPPDVYFKDHPEYFSEIGGERAGERAQLCLTNPDVLRIATGEVMKWIEETPDATIFSVSQNDWGGNCACPKCRAIDAAEGTPMGTVLLFVNAIADAVAAKHPDKVIDTLAYTYTEKPPKTIRPRPNVVIRLCHMAPSCDFHPLAKCFMNEKYVRNLKKWNTLTDRIYVWHYVTNFSHYLAPFPNLNAIIKDIPFYANHGVKGFFGQGSYQGLGGDMAELKAWVIAKLLWNPARRPDELINDFINGYYGPAAPPIERYYKALHKHSAKPTVHAHLFSDPAPYLTKDLIELGEKSFDEAEKIAAGNPDLLKRVRRARLPVAYAQIAVPHVMGWKPEELRKGGAHDQWARIDRFENELREFNVAFLRESETADKTIEKMRENLKKLTGE